jgi:hypothetical protein
MPAQTWTPTGDEKADAIVNRYLESDELDATCQGLSPACIEACAFVLANSNTVQACLLAGNDMGDELAETLAKGIRQNRYVALRAPHAPRFSQASVRSQAPHAERPPVDSSMPSWAQHLWNQLPPGHVVNACAMLQGTKRSGCRVTIALCTSEFVQFKSQNTRSCRSCKGYYMNKNNLGPKGIEAFANALKWNDNVFRVNLSGNPIGTGGARALKTLVMAQVRSLHGNLHHVPANRIVQADARDARHVELYARCAA